MIKDNNSTYGTFIVSSCHWRKSFLSCNVPKLQPDLQVIIELEHFQLKINSNGGSVIASVAKVVVNVSFDQCGFPSGYFTDDNHFVQPWRMSINKTHSDLFIFWKMSNGWRRGTPATAGHLPRNGRKFKKSSVRRIRQGQVSRHWGWGHAFSKPGSNSVRSARKA